MQTKHPKIRLGRRAFDRTQVLVPGMDAARQHQLLGKNLFEAIVACDLAGHVADDAAEIGFQRLERSLCPLELFGMGIALLLDEGVFGDPRISLAQREAVLLGEPHQPFAGPVHQLRIGRESDRLRLHGRIHDDLGKVGGLGRTAAGRDRKAFLQQRNEPFFAHPLPPAGQRRAVEG